MTKELERFIGTWRTIGRILPRDDEHVIAVVGHDTYQWIIDPTIVLHKVDLRIGNERLRSCEIIGPIPNSHDYFMHSYDSSGDAGRTTVRRHGPIWRFQGPALRFAGKFDADGQKFSGVWEKCEQGGNWTPWMEIELARLTEPAEPTRVGPLRIL